MRKQKTGGRKKGVPNKTTEELRSMVQLFIENNIERLQTDFDLLEPKDRLNFIERLLKMVVPAPISDLSQLSERELDTLIDKLKKQQDE